METTAWVRAFRAMNKTVMSKMGAKANSAGSTAVVAVLSAQMIQVNALVSLGSYADWALPCFGMPPAAATQLHSLCLTLSHTLSQVGNLGDSRAIIGRVDDNMGALRVIELTSDQTPHRYHPRRTEGTKGSTRSCWEVAAQVPRQTSDEREGPKSDPPSPAGVSWRGWITEPTSDAVGFGRSEDERKRLLACGTIVEISTYEVKKGRKTYKSFDDMCANATHLDPLRVYVKGAMAPGLALSRSIGDGIGKVRAASSRRPWVRRDVAEAEAEARERQHG